MSIFNNGNFAKPFNVSQPQLNSSDRTANLRSKTKYASAVNLAKNGGVLTKRDGSKYVGPVHTTSATMTSADSYSDLLDVTKGKYLLTPPPSSNLDTSFSPASGDVFYGSFTVTDYAEAKIPVTMLGAPGVTTSPAPTKYDDPNKLVVPVAPASAPPPFNNTSIVVDPEYRMFYGKKTCGMRDYFKNVRIDPSADVRWTADGVVHSSRPYNQQQAQRILAHEAQRLRGFQYPARVHLDLDNCESKPSITPVAPDAPVIYISSQTLTSDEPELFTVTVAWPHGFDGGSPITSYTVYTSTGESYTVNDPQPCLNSWTLYHVALTTQIWVSATNCIPQSSWPSGTPAPHCTPMTSPQSNPVNPAPPHLPTITIAFSSGPNPMPYEPNKVITMTITSDNPMPFSVTSSQLDNGLAQLNQPNGGSGTRALTTTNSYSITLVSGKNPTVPRTTISVSFMQASGGGYSRGFATANLVILPALPPKITIGLAASTVQYAPNTTIPMPISSNYPVAQSDYAVSTNNSGLTRINTLTNAGGQIVGYTVSLIANPSAPSQQVTITVTQPATANYPSGTATKMLTITSAPPPTITIGLPATVQYVPNATIPMTIGTTSNPTLTPQSAYQVSLSSNASSLAQISTDKTSIQLLPNANPSALKTIITITVIQPGTANYPSGTATKTLTITPAPPPTLTLTLNPASPVYAPDKNIALTITSSNPTSPPAIVASAGSVTFTFQSPSSVGNLIVSSTDYNNYAVGQVLTATPGSGTFGGATVTVTSKFIGSVGNPVYFINVSVVGGNPSTGNLTISNVMASFPKYTVTSSNSGLVQINPPSSGSSNYTLVLGSPNPAPNTPPVTITVVQSESGSFGRGTATKALTITPAPPPTITIGLPATVQYVPNATIPMTIGTTSNPTLTPQSAYQVSLSSNAASLAQISTDKTSIQLLATPSTQTSITITVTQPATQYYPSGTATKVLTITPAPPPTVTVALNPASPVTYVSGAKIALSITSTSNPQPQLSAYTVKSSNTNLARIIDISTGGDTIMGYAVELIANPSAPSQPVTITVTQPATQYYPSGTGTATLTIIPVPIITLTLTSPVMYEPGKSIPLTITSTNPPPTPFIASAGSVVFDVDKLSVSATDYNNYAVGQFLTAVPGSGTFGGATVTVTGKNINNAWGSNYYIYLSVVGGSPASGDVSNVMSSNYAVTSTPAGLVQQIVPPSSGSSNYTLVLASNAYPTQDMQGTITVIQAASGGFAQGTATKPLTIQPIQMTQKNFIGWLPQGLTSQQPDFMTQEIVITTANNIYNQPNTNIQCPNDSTAIGSNITLSQGQQLNVGTVYIGTFPSNQALTFNIAYPNYTQIYIKTFPAGTVPTTGLFNFTLDFSLNSHPIGTYVAYWYAGGNNFTLNCANNTQRLNWCGSLGTATTGTPFHVMGFNTGGNYTLSRYNQGATSLTTLLTGSGSITSINEQLITNPSMSGGSRNLIVCGNFQSATISTTSTTTRVNNIFQYNVDTQAVIPLQCATTSPTTPPTYQVGTNGQVWGCEVDTANNRVWVWGDFTGCGTLASGGDSGVAALGVNLATGADFVTSANWTNPVSWQGCAAYLGVHAAKLGGASTGYALFCYKLQDYNGSQPAISNPKTGVVRQAATNWYSGTYLNGSNISGTVLSIYQFGNQFGNWFIFAGEYTQATYDGTNATTAYSMSIMDATKTISAGGVYGAALQPTMKNTDATFWKNGGYPTIPSRIAMLSSNYLCITTSGYPVGSIMTYDFNNNNIESNTVAPTKWGGFTAPYSANYIGGTDPNSVKLIASINASPFYYSQTFNMKPITLQISGFTPQDYTIIYLDANGVHDPTRTTPYLNGYTVHKFYPTSTTSGTITSNIPITNLSYLVIGGGGGGGNPSNDGGNPNDQAGGGGGAGGFVSNYPSGPTITLQSTGYNLTVGGGGAANTAGTASSLAYANGTITSLGGGYGGSVNQSGGNGGSGGGGGGAPSSGPPPGGSGMQGQGNGGASGGGVLVGYMGSTFAQHGGGGGGAGGGGSIGGTSAGSIFSVINGSWGGSGGSGLQSNIDGTVSTYAGGGGGGAPGATYNGSPYGGMGGSGIGGNGGNAGGGSGTNGTGSGGGGGFTAGGQNFGGTGGSGIVILRFSSYSYNQ
jgi:hypothetical protein